MLFNVRLCRDEVRLYKGSSALRVDALHVPSALAVKVRPLYRYIFDKKLMVW